MYLVLPVNYPIFHTVGGKRQKQKAKQGEKKKKKKKKKGLLPSNKVTFEKFKGPTGHNISQQH